MLKNIITGLTAALSVFSAIVVASVSEVDNWFAISLPWVIVFFVSVSVGIIVNNLEFIRRYTYPAFVCLLAWANEHNIIKSNFAKQSNYIYRKHNKSYGKLYEVTQYLYDRVMFSEV